MEHKHTPGPWRSKKARTLIHVQGDSPICEISVSANHIHEDSPGAKASYIATQEANARLIAAAPDLLDALQALFDSYKQLADSGDSGFWKLEEQPEGQQALAAIAKATGTQP